MSASCLTWVILSKGLWADAGMMVCGNIFTEFRARKSWPFVSLSSLLPSSGGIRIIRLFYRKSVLISHNFSTSLACF